MVSEHCRPYCMQCAKLSFEMQSTKESLMTDRQSKTYMVIQQIQSSHNDRIHDPMFRQSSVFIRGDLTLKLVTL